MPRAGVEPAAYRLGGVAAARREGPRTQAARRFVTHEALSDEDAFDRIMLGLGTGTGSVPNHNREASRCGL